MFALPVAVPVGWCEQRGVWHGCYLERFCELWVLMCVDFHQGDVGDVVAVQESLQFVELGQVGCGERARVRGVE